MVISHQSTSCVYQYAYVGEAYCGGSTVSEPGYAYFGARYYSSGLSVWLSVDPLAGNYPSMSPYMYTAGNPIMLVDPDGMRIGDFYNQKGKYLGTDGKTDKKNYVVTDKKEIRAIKKATRKSKDYSNDVKSKVELPGYSIRNEMGKAVDRAGKNSFHEEGGVIANMADGSKKVVNAKSGKEADPSVDGYASIDVLDAADPTEVKGYSTLSGTFHTHPDGEIVKTNVPNAPVSGSTIGGTETTYSFTQSPSGPDISNHKARANRGLVTGNSYVLGTGNNTVYIYDGGGVKATFPLLKFRTRLRNE